MTRTSLSELRSDLHRRLLSELTETRPNKFAGVARSMASGLPCYSMADSDSELSIAIAAGMVEAMDVARRWGYALQGDKSGRQFQRTIAAFVEAVFAEMQLGPGHGFEVIVPVQRGKIDRRLPTQGDPRSTSTIANFEAYAHLLAIDELVRKDGRIRAAFGGDYFVRPDILVWKHPMRSEDLAEGLLDADARERTRSPALADGGGGNVLHATISCKWTMRSDRSQNTRTEALNLIRNRKGRVPHITAVVMEPLPSRIASIAQGTGDVDCTYHCALPELMTAMASVRTPAADQEREILEALVEGRRVRDVSDLPMDLLL